MSLRFNKKWCVVAAWLLSSCTMKNTTDKTLDQYEKVIARWETKSNHHNLDFTDIQHLQEDVMSIDHPETLVQKEKLSPLQKERAEKLSKRIGKLIPSL